MFLKKVKYKQTTYYYLMRRIPGTEKQEQLTTMGSLDDGTSYKEEDLIKNWVYALLSGGENKRRASIDLKKDILIARARDFGQTFDLEKCIRELKAIHVKYGQISKQLLEKKARPNGDLSWGTSTILNQLRNRGMTLAQVFDIARGTI